MSPNRIALELHADAHIILAIHHGVLGVIDTGP